MRYTLLLVFVCSWMAVFAQKNYKPTEVKELKGRELKKFHSSFFLAVKERHKGNTDKAEEALDECLKIADDRSSVYTEYALLYKEMGKQTESIENAKKAYELDKSNRDLLELLLNLLSNSRMYNLAANYLDEYIQISNLGDKGIKDRLELADFYLYQNKLEDAIKVYQQLEKEYGVNKIYTGQQYKIFLSQAQYDKAEQAAQKLVETYKGQVSYQINLAQVYEAQNQNLKARDVYLEILKANPNNGKANLNLADLMVEEGMENEALAYYKKAFLQSDLNLENKIRPFNQLINSGLAQSLIIDLAKNLVAAHPSNAKAFTLLGDAYYEANQKNEALSYYEKSLSIDPNNFILWQQVASTQYELKRFDQLDKTTTVALEIYPSQPLFYLFSGVAKIERDEHLEAIEVLNMGLVYLFGNNELKSQFHLLLADAYFELKDYKSAFEYFDKNLAIDPNDATTLNNYAYFLAKSNQSLADALKMSKKSLELQAKNANFMDTYAWVWFKKGDYNQAKEWLDKAIALDANSAELFEHLGDVYFHLKDPQKAVDNWKKAQKLGDDSKLLNKKIENKTYYEE